MSPDAATVAELAQRNEVLWACLLTISVAALVIGMVCGWLEAKLEQGCPQCSHCLHKAKEKARKSADAQNAYEHRLGLHEKDCPCPRGGPPRPRP